jgi:hypothetical protein
LEESSSSEVSMENSSDTESEDEVNNLPGKMRKAFFKMTFG